jgi:transcription initiation factor TFIIIB Brf1 subunit/transcription initiation factor TFIIB
MKFEINSTTLEIENTNAAGVVTAIGQEESAIFKKMYFIHDYEKKLRSVVGAASLDAIVQISDLGTTIRKVNKNEVGKTFSQIKKQEVEELYKMISAYKISAAAPRQVAGDDTEEGYYTDSKISKRTGY